MRHYGLAAILAGLVITVGPSAVRADDSKMYVVEPPDILRLDVTGLPKKAQRVKGEFLVRPDGTVSLGTYGSVAVTGLTLDQTRAAITKHLSAHAKKKNKLEVRAEVSGYNSKVYYVIALGKDGEKEVYRFPLVGNDTVVNAVLQVEGLAALASKGTVWVARLSSDKILKVDWRAITQEGQSASNIKLQSGDRVFVGSALPK